MAEVSSAAHQKKEEHDKNTSMVELQPTAAQQKKGDEAATKVQISDTPMGWPPDESKFGPPKPQDMPKTRSNAGEDEPYPVGGRYMTNHLMKLRQAEDLKSPILASLQPKAYVEILEKGQSEKRAKVRVNGMDGWISLLNKDGEPLLDEVPAEHQSAMILDYNLGKFSSGLESISKAIRADEGELPQKVYPTMKPREKPILSEMQISASTLALLEQATSVSGEVNPAQHKVRSEQAGIFSMKHHSHARLHNAMSQMAFLLAQRARMRGQHFQEEEEQRNLREHADMLQQRVNFTKREAQYWQKRSEHDSVDFTPGFQGTASHGQSPYEVQEATMALQGCIQQVQSLKGQLSTSSIDKLSQSLD